MWMVALTLALAADPVAPVPPEPVTLDEGPAPAAADAFQPSRLDTTVDWGVPTRFGGRPLFRRPVLTDEPLPGVVPGSPRRTRPVAIVAVVCGVAAGALFVTPYSAMGLAVATGALE